MNTKPRRLDRAQPNSSGKGGRKRSKPRDLGGTSSLTIEVDLLGQGSERASYAYNPIWRAVAGGGPFSKNILGEVDSDLCFCALADQVIQTLNGNMRNVETTLAAQANTLDLIFNSLARRAAFSDALPQYEVFMRLALKAQSQCRTTLETLAVIKNPAPVAFVRQANIGQNVQVNNGPEPSVLARAGETEIPPSKLLEATHGERLDIEPANAAGEVDQDLAAVAAINRPKKRRG